MCEYSLGYHRVISNTVNMRPSSVCLLCGMIWIYLRGYECCRFGPEVNCGFPCRCTDGNQCNSETGECAPGSECLSVLPDGYGWSGTGCRIGNVAYKKTASQSGAYLHYFADLAVDGLTYPYITNMKNETCAHPLTQTSKLAWWEVDLGATYRIQSITIINRNHRVNPSIFQERTGHFYLRIGNDSNPQHECLYRGVPIGDQATLYCNNAYTVGRYIRFQRTSDGKDPNEANFCEFIVMGYETIDCDDENCPGTCDRLAGCDTCTHGKMLPDCKNDCPDGYWGENCVNRCGQCKDDLVCDKVTGSCGEQCDGWLLPELCNELLGPSPEILNVMFLNIASDAATLLWVIQSGVDDDVKRYFHYIVRYRKKFQLEMLQISDKIPLSNDQSMHHKLLGLDYNTNYEVEIVPYRDINGQTESGTVWIEEFKTLCIVSAIDGTTKLLEQVEDNGPNITAIAVGAVSGVVIIILVVVIAVLVLRRRTPMPSGGTKPDTNSPGYGKANPVYENTKDSHNDETGINPPGEYASVEDTAKVDMKVSPTTSTHRVYENTKGPESEYESLDESLRTTTKPSPLYQELK